VAVVKEAVEDRCRYDGASKDRPPFSDRPVRGNQQGAAFIAPTADRRHETGDANFSKKGLTDYRPLQKPLLTRVLHGMHAQRLCEGCRRTAPAQFRRSTPEPNEPLPEPSLNR